MPAQTGYYLDTINQLRNIDATIRTNGYSRLVGDTGSWYFFIAGDTAIADNLNIIEPLAGSGRWYRTKSLVNAPDVLNLTEYIDDRVASLLSNSNTIQDSYNDTSNTLTLEVQANSINDVQVSTISTSKITGLDNTLANKAALVHTHSPIQITDLQEFIQDVVGGLIQAGSNISIVYSDASNTFTISGTPSPLEVREEGTSIGAVSSFNFTGDAVTASNVAGVANITVNTPVLEIAVEKEGTLAGNVNRLNFTGSGVNTITVSGSEATIDLSGGNSGASALVEQNYTITTGSIPYQGIGSAALTGELALLLRKVSSNYPCRIRIYSNSSYATNDSARPISQELQGEHGCLLEVVTTPSNLEIDLAPPVFIYKPSAASNIIITIDNLDSTARVFNLVFTSLKW